MTDVGLIPCRIRSQVDQVDLTSQQLDTHEHDRSVKSTRLLHSLSNSPTLLSPIHNGGYGPDEQRFACAQFFPNVFKLAELTAEQVAELHKKMTQGVDIEKFEWTRRRRAFALRTWSTSRLG